MPMSLTSASGRQLDKSDSASAAEPAVRTSAPCCSSSARNTSRASASSSTARMRTPDSGGALLVDGGRAVLRLSRARGPAAHAAPALAGVRVLAVDDEADARELMRALLGQHGAEVRTAGSAAEALAALREFQPDVLVSDLGMPGESGHQLLRRVRAQKPSGECVRLSACDPLNLVGIVVPGARVAAVRGKVVYFRDGEALSPELALDPDLGRVETASS